MVPTAAAAGGAVNAAAENVAHSVGLDDDYSARRYASTSHGRILSRC